MLLDQGIQNNQQVIAIILQMNENEAAKEGNIFDKLQEIRDDATTLLNSSGSFMDVSSQSSTISTFISTRVDCNFL